MVKTVTLFGCLFMLLFSSFVFADNEKGSEDKMPTIQEFQSFYKQYEDACRNKDADFLKDILPPDVPEDEFAFVLEMSYQSTLSLDASGVKPRIEQTDNRYDVIYEGDLGDGMTKMVVDFYFHEGRWLKTP